MKHRGGVWSGASQGDPPTKFRAHKVTVKQVKFKSSPSSARQKFLGQTPCGPRPDPPPTRRGGRQGAFFRCYKHILRNGSFLKSLVPDSVRSPIPIFCVTGHCPHCGPGLVLRARKSRCVLPSRPRVPPQPLRPRANAPAGRSLRRPRLVARMPPGIVVDTI